MNLSSTSTAFDYEQPIDAIPRLAPESQRKPTEDLNETGTLTGTSIPAEPYKKPIDTLKKLHAPEAPVSHDQDVSVDEEHHKTNTNSSESKPVQIQSGDSEHTNHTVEESIKHNTVQDHSTRSTEFEHTRLHEETKLKMEASYANLEPHTENITSL